MNPRRRESTPNGSGREKQVMIEPASRLQGPIDAPVSRASVAGVTQDWIVSEDVRGTMPTISVFYGIVIQMYWQDHPPPHFHALYAEHEVLIDFRDLSVLRGSLPRRAMGLVLEWAAEHRDELTEDWISCSNLQTPKPIAPLK